MMRFACLVGLLAMALAASAQTPGRPQPGDTWTYLLKEPRRTEGPKERSYTVTVAGITGTAIIDRYVIDGVAAGELAHEWGSYLVSAGAALFSPYLEVFDGVMLPQRRSLGRILIRDDACSGQYLCTANAVVKGHETVKVLAGSFDTIKVEIEHSWRPAGMSGVHGAQLQGARKLTVWYSPAVKRAVKYSSRPEFGAVPPINPDFDLELVSYKLN